MLTSLFQPSQDKLVGIISNCYDQLKQFSDFYLLWHNWLGLIFCLAKSEISQTDLSLV